MVLRLVAENAKQRFELFYGIDPSPPKPKIKKGQNKGKGKAKPPTQATPSGQSKEERPDVSSRAGRPANAFSGSANQRPVQEAGAEIDAAVVEDLSKDMDQTAISAELPLIALPAPSSSDDDAESSKIGSKADGEWFIRATQGHSIKLESVSHLTPVLDDEDGRSRAGVCVHGTKWELWDTLSEFPPQVKGERTLLIAGETGLSRMGRTHIHLAPALADHPILPRPGSTLRIYLDIPKLLSADIPLYTSSNGVVLTPGIADGVVSKEYWKLAERKVDGKWVPVLRDGQEV